MRILLCLHHYLDPNQGAPGATLALGEGLASQGCDVEYYGFENAFSPDHQGGPLDPVRFPWQLASYLTHHAARFDVLDISTGDNWVWARRGRPGAKPHHALITRSHGLEHIAYANLHQEAKAGSVPMSWQYARYHGGYRLWEVNQSLRLADRVLMLNQQDCEYAVTRLQILREKIRLVANGIPEYLIGLPFDTGGSSQTAPLKIVQIGTYLERKGIVYSVRALNMVLARHPDITMTFLGAGCLEEQVHADFDPAVRAQVSVIPRYSREDLPNLLRECQVMLFPSLSEGFSLALPEAMACGLAPVATAIPGNIEIARDEENALLIPPRDSIAIEQALERLIGDCTLLKRLRGAAYAAAQQYGWRRIASETIALYDEALEARFQ